MVWKPVLTPLIDTPMVGANLSSSAVLIEGSSSFHVVKLCRSNADTSAAGCLQICWQQRISLHLTGTVQLSATKQFGRSI